MQGLKRAKSCVKGASFSSLNKDKMLNGGHFDLNSVRFCSDSLKERLKQMMINQELAFVGQVFELHRLYGIQIAMTDEIKQRGLDNYNSRVDLDSSAVNLNKLVKSRMTPGFTQKPVDLQLSADEFIRQSSYDLSGKEIISKNSFQYTSAFDLNRSLTVGEDSGKRTVEHRSWLGKRTLGPPPDIIDLENPSSNYHADLRLPSDLITPNSSRHVYYGSSSRRPFDNVVQQQTLCNAEFGLEIAATNTPVLGERFKLDLNTVQLEDLSCVSCSPSGASNSEATAFPATTKMVYCQSTVASYVSPTSFRGSNVVNVGHKSVDTAAGKIVYIDIASDSGEELCNSDNPKIESVGSNVHCVSSKEAEVDETEQKAAELLVQLSRVTLTYSNNVSEIETKEDDDTPQRSSESYEAMMLSAKECGPEDYCVSSNAIIVEDASEKKDGRYKLKRGTRMKDFQRDILSSLSTLSRHEIREDINIFEGVIKSREYKRMRAKMGDGDIWCRPTRNKRSRISRV